MFSITSFGPASFNEFVLQEFRFNGRPYWPLFGAVFFIAFDILETVNLLDRGDRPQHGYFYPRKSCLFHTYRGYCYPCLIKPLQPNSISRCFIYILRVYDYLAHRLLHSCCLLPTLSHSCNCVSRWSRRKTTVNQI